MISIHLVPEFLHDVRTLLREALPTASAGHIAEAFAECVGFQTHAGLLSAIRGAKTTRVALVDDTKFRKRLSRLAGFDANEGVCTAAAFEALLVDLIRLARLRSDAGGAKVQRHNLPGFELAMELLRPGYKPPALHQLLHSLPHETLIHIEAVMYVGRDGGGFAPMLKYLRDLNDTGDLAAHISAKSQLDQFLTRALGFARQVGVAEMWQSLERWPAQHESDDDLQDEGGWLDEFYY